MKKEDQVKPAEKPESIKTSKTPWPRHEDKQPWPSQRRSYGIVKELPTGKPKQDK